MFYGSVRKPQKRIRQSGRWSKAVSKLLPPVETEEGVATEYVAPAVFRPIGRSITNDTGILFPVFFWSCADRAGALQKGDAPKIPTLSVAAIPDAGMAYLPFFQSEPSHFALFFARPTSPTVLLVVTLRNKSTITRIATEERLSNEAVAW